MELKRGLENVYQPSTVYGQPGNKARHWYLSNQVTVANHPPDNVVEGSEHFQKLRQRGNSFGKRDDIPEVFQGVMGIREVVLARKVLKSG